MPKIETALKDKKYICEHPGCEKGYGRQDYLKRHAAKHNPDEWFSCRFCSSTFWREDVLKKHIKTSCNARKDANGKILPLDPLLEAELFRPKRQRKCRDQSQSETSSSSPRSDCSSSSGVSQALTAPDSIIPDYDHPLPALIGSVAGSTMYAASQVHDYHGSLMLPMPPPGMENYFPQTMQQDPGYGGRPGSNLQQPLTVPFPLPQHSGPSLEPRVGPTPTFDMSSFTAVHPFADDRGGAQQHYNNSEQPGPTSLSQQHYNTSEPVNLSQQHYSLIFNLAPGFAGF